MNAAIGIVARLYGDSEATIRAIYDAPYEGIPGSRTNVVRFAVNQSAALLWAREELHISQKTLDAMKPQVAAVTLEGRFGLTPGQVRYADLAIKGVPYREVAEIVGARYQVVKNIMHRVLLKVGVKNVTELAAVAARTVELKRVAT